MVFSWLNSLRRGIIRGHKSRKLGQPRRRVNSLSNQITISPLVPAVESLETRQMLSAQPVADSYSVNANQVLQVSGTFDPTVAQGILTNDTGVVYTYNSVTHKPTGDTAVVTLQPNDGVLSVASNGYLTFDPTSASALQSLSQGEDLVETFDYGIFNQTTHVFSSTIATDTIDVHGVNQAPVVTALSQSQSFTEGGTVTLTPITISDENADDTETATLTVNLPAGAAPGSPLPGSLSTGTFGGATSTYNSSSGIWTVSGSQTDVNAALAAVTFTPSAHNDQNFTISTSVQDSFGGGPAFDTLTGSINMSVTPVETPPIANPDTNSVLQAVGSVPGAGTTATGNVITDGNDVEFDTGVTLTATAVSCPANSNSATVGGTAANVSGQYGTLTLNSNGAYTYVINQSVAAVQALTVGQTLTEIFNYTINNTGEPGDPTGDSATSTLTITITGEGPIVSVAPTASVTVFENQTATNSGTFVDPDGTIPTVQASLGTITSNNDGVWTWSLAAPIADYTNQTVTITAIDNLGAQTTTSFVLNVNDVPPTVAANSASASAVFGTQPTMSGTFSSYEHAVTITASTGGVSTGTIVQDNVHDTWTWTGNAQTSTPYTVTITATDTDGGITTTTFGVNFFSTSTVYVDASLAGDTQGQIVTVAGSVQAAYGVNAFSTIQAGINAVNVGGTVNVAAGTYKENDTIGKSLSLEGANAGTLGTATRGAETHVITNGNQVAVFTVTASNVTIDGFTLDGNDPLVLNPGGTTLSSGVDSNAEYGVNATGTISGLTVQNSIIENVYIGVNGNGKGSGSVITGNWFDSVGAYDFGYGVDLQNNFYANVTNNTFTRVQSGLKTNDFNGAGGPANWLFEDNSVQAYGAGVWDNLRFNGATSLTISGNTFTSVTAPSSVPGFAEFNGQTVGIMLVSIQNAVTDTITDNSITGMGTGVVLFNTSTTNTITIDGSNTISDNGVGIDLTNLVGFNPVGTTILGGAANNPNGVGAVTLNDLTLTGNTTGVLVSGNSPDTTFGVSLNIENGTTISGGTTGLEIDGSQTSVTGKTLDNTAFTGESGNYITLADGALVGQTLDATSSTFAGSTGAANTLAANFAVEDKITHAVDNESLGFVRVKANNVFVTPNSGSIQRGVDAASSGDTVNVRAGTFKESGANLTIGKPLDLQGANSGTAGSAGTNGVAGTRVAESDLITNGNQSAVITVTASNVTIDGLTIDGDDPSVVGSPVQSGHDSNATYGVRVTSTTATGLTLKNSIIQDTAVGFRGDGPSVGANTGNNITNNLFDNIGVYDFGYAITLRSNYYANITGNVMREVYTGVQINNFYQADVGEFSLANNDIQSYANGLWYNLSYQSATSLDVSGNTFSQVPGSPVADTIGVLITNGPQNVGATFENDSISGDNYGVVVWDTPNGPTLGATNTITNVGTGVLVTDDVGFNPIGTTLLNLVTVPSSVDLEGVSITASGIGVDVQSHTSGAASTVTSANGTTIDAGTTDLVVDGALASITGLTLAGTIFSGTGNYIDLMNGAMVGETIDGTGATYGGVLGANVTLPQGFAIEDKITHAVDDESLGFVRVKAKNVYVTTNSGSIQRGIDAASDNDTVNVSAGTFVENSTGNVGGLDITKPLTLLGAQAGVSADSVGSDTARPGNETIILPSVSDPDPFDATSPNVVYISTSNVTIDGFTIDGDNPNLTSPVNLNGANIDAETGIASYTGIGNITVQNNIIQNLSYTGIDLENDDNPAATTNNVITHNLIQNLGGGGYGYGVGVLLYNNFYAQVSENTITGVRVGVQTGNYSDADPAAPPTGADPSASISDNAISAQRIGIFFNLMYDNTSTFTIDANQISAINDTISDAREWDGMLIGSVESAVNVSITNNVIDGSATSILASGYNVWSDPTSANLTISGGSVTGVDQGVWVNNYEGYNSNGQATNVTVDGVAISASQIGVYVLDSSNAGNTSHAAVSATITDGTSITLTGSNGTGVSVVSNGGDASVAFGDGTTISGGATGLLIDGTNASVDGTDNSLNDTTFTGQSGNYITLADGAMSGGEIDATGADFDGKTDATNTLDQYYDLEDRITDALDTSGLGLVRLEAGHVFVTQLSDSIQRGVDAASNNDIVNVQAGTFVENSAGNAGGLDITKPLTLLGAQSGVDPRSGRTGAETVILSSLSDPDPYSPTSQIVVYVDSSNVTIDGFTVDGNNQSLSSPVTVNGKNIDAAEGIVSYDGVGNITVQNNIVENTTYTGIDFYNYDNDAATDNNLITHNLLQDLGGGGYGFGVGVLLYNNFYADVTENTMTNVLVGVQTGNFSMAAPVGAVEEISDNQIAASGVGIFYNLHYSAATGFSIDNNSITAIDDSTQTVWDGIVVSSQQDTVGATFSGNTIDGTGVDPSTSSVGVEVWNTPTTGNIIISGGSITGVEDGVLVTVNDPFEGDGDSTQATISGVNINASQIGVDVVDSATASSATATASITDNTSITVASGGIGVEVENNLGGGGASATFGTGTTITGGTTGLLVDGANASIAGDTLNSTAFKDQSGDYITLADGAMFGSVLDASDVTFDGSTGFANTPAQNVILEGKITDFNDNPSLGLVRILTQVTPVVTETVIGSGMAYTGQALSVTENVTGAGGATLSDYTPTFTYYAGPTVTATPLSGAPTDAGTYTVVASYIPNPGGQENQDYLSAMSSPTTFTIAQANVSYTIGDQSQTYGSPATLANPTIATGVNGENLIVTESSTGDTATADVGGYAITGVAGDGTGLASNYNVTFTPGTLTVGQANVSYTIGDQSQTYGSPATLANPTITTGVNGQNLTITESSTGDTTTAHVGNYAITGVVGDGTGLASDYNVTITPGTLTVGQANVSYTIGDQSQTYGSPAILANPTIATGVNGQNLTITESSTGDTTTANVGGYAITGVAADGTGLASDYNVTITPGTLTVGQANVSYTIGDQSQTYGSPATLANPTIATGVNGENLVITESSTGDTATADVGGYAITGVAGDGTGLASNYNVTITPGTLTVGQADVSYTIGDQSQTYGSPATLANPTIATGVNGQNLTITESSSGDTATADVGGYAITGVVSDGTGLASDYSVTITPGTLTVGQANVSYTIGDQSQTYGSPATLANPTIATGVNGQNLTITESSTGDTATAHVGSYAITGVAGDGTGLASDYNVTFTSGTLTVGQANVSYTIGDQNQTYGSPATLANPTIATGVNGQNLTITESSTGDTTTANVGGYAITGVAADGTGLASDYNVTITPGTLTVGQANVSYTIGDQSQTYGSPATLANPTIATGVNGENLVITESSTGDTATADVGGYAITGVAGDGTGLASNYNVTITPGTLTVGQADVSYTIGDQSQTYGSPATLANPTIATGVNGQNLTITESSSGDTATADVGGYAITGVVSDGTGLASDYSVTITPGTLTVGQANVSYTIGDQSQTYGSPATLANPTIATGVNGQNLTITESSTGDTATAHVGSYAITGVAGDGTGLASDYNVTFTSGTLTVGQANVSYTIGDQNQTYGSPATLANPTIATGVNGQNLTITESSTGDTTTANVGGYAITGVAADGTGLASDYNVTITPGTLTVGQANISYTIANQSQTFGNPATLANPTISGVNGETLNVTESSTGDTATAHVGNYPITGVVSNGTGLVSNYNVTITPGTLSVNVSGPVTSEENQNYPTYTVNLLSNAGNPATLSVTGLTLVSGDDSGIAISPDSTTLTITPSAYAYLSAGEQAVITYSYNVVDTSGLSVATTATITIDGLNDAPTINDTSIIHMNNITANETNGLGTSTESLVLSRIDDVDIDSVQTGMVIVGQGGNPSLGTWQFSTNSGVAWANITGTSLSNALHLIADATDEIRFVPKGTLTGNATLTVMAWDTTNLGAVVNGKTVADGAYVPILAEGGTTAYSTVLPTQLKIEQTVLTAASIPPIAELPIPDQTGYEGQPFSFTINPNSFVEQDSETLTYRATVGGAALPAWLTFNSATGNFSGTPGASDVGTLGITVTAENTAFQNVSTTFFLTVIPTPTVTAQTTASLNENTTLTFSTGNSNAISLTDTYAVASSDSLTLSVAHGILTLGSTTGLSYTSGANGSASMTVNGTLANLNAALSGLIYTPTNGYSGSDALNLLLSDSGINLTGSASTAITVNAPPAVIAPTNASVTINTSLTFSTGNSNAISLVDAAAVGTSDTVALSVTHGTLTLGSTTGLTFTSGTNGTATMTIWGTLANLNAALSGLVYTPTAGYSGSATLAITSKNYHDNLTETTNVALNVVVPPPVVTAPTTGSLTENSSLSFSTGNSNAISVVDAYAVANSDTVTLTVTHGKLTLGSTTGITFTSGTNGAAAMTIWGTLASLNAALSGLTFTPTTGYAGSVSLAVTAKNGHDNQTGSTTVALTVNAFPVVTAPTTGSLYQNASLTFSTGNSNAISLVDVSAVGSSDSVTLSVTNGTLTLGSITGLTFSSGTNGAASMTVNGTLANLNAALSGLVYTPTAGYFGSDALAVALKDAGDSLTGSANVALTVNGPPAVTAPTTASVTENSSLTFSTGNSNAISVVDASAVANSDTVTLTVTHGKLMLGSTTGITFTSGSNSAAAMTIWGTLANLNAALSGLTFTPTTGYFGSASLSVTAKNGHDNLTGSATVALTVNALPVVTAPTTGSLYQNASLTFSTGNSNAISLVDVSAVGSSDSVTLSVTHGTLTLGSITGLTFSSGANGAASMTVNGTLANLNAALSGLVYTPTAGYFGSDALTVTLSDSGDSLTGSANVALTVNGPPAVTAPTTASVTENSSLTFSTGNSNAISVVDASAVGTSDTVTLTVTHGKLTLGSTTGITFTSGTNGAATMTIWGTLANLNAALSGLTFTPTTGYAGSASLAVTAKNGRDNFTGSASVGITVTP